MNIILFIFWIIMILFIILETDAIPKWAEFLKFRCMKYAEFNEKRKIFPDLKYKNFLSAYHSNFFVALFTCQECLCVWLNILGFICFGKYIGGWAYFGISTIGSLLGIAFFNFLLKKIYE